MSFLDTPRKAVIAALVAISTIAVGGCHVTQVPEASRRYAPIPASTILMGDEIARAHPGSAYEAVERLRPAFLRETRGVPLFGERTVYLDGMKLGGLRQLQTISAYSVREIRYLSAIEATARFGPGNPSGAIVVVTDLVPGRPR
jgi:hypothetical protein